MNFGTPVPLLIGIILILFSIFLFFLEKFKPGYKRDSDVIYASLALAAGILNLVDLTGGFLHSSQSVIFTGVFISLALEAINGRTPDSRPSGGMPSRDDDRGPRNYRAGVEETYTAMDDRSSRRQMRDGRSARDEADGRDSRSPGRSDRDRFLEDRPRRRSRYDEPSQNLDMGRGSRLSQDEFGDDIRSIPERTSASDSARDRGRNRDGGMDRSSMDRNGMERSGSIDDVPRPRRRPMNEEGGVSASRRGGRPTSDNEPSTSDYVDFRPVEPIPPKESWGPKDS